MDNQIEALIETLHDFNPQVWEAAGQSLFQIGPTAILPLVNSLDDSVIYFRKNVGTVLARFGELALKLLVNKYFERSNDEFNYNHENVIIPMALFGEAAIFPLVEILKNDIMLGYRYNPIQWESVRALGKIGEPAQKQLLNLIKDQNPENRTVAALGLGGFKNSQSVSALINP